MRIKLVVCIVLVSLAASCTMRLVDFTAISTKNIPIKPRILGHTEGKDCAYTILFIPTGMPNIEDAVDDALQNYPEGNVLLNGVLYYEYISLPFFSRYCYRIEGQAAEIK